jgi:sodium/bile acid cotransporter 7
MAFSIPSFARQNSFVLLLLGAVAMGAWTPAWGASGGYLHSEWLTKAGVFVIFLLQGVGLSTASLRRGLGEWRVHLFTQSWISLGVPALVALARWLAGDWGGVEFWAGMWFLAVLPTTITSAVALISHAEGNVAAGVFNTVFSNIGAVLIVPLWVLAYEAASGAQMPALWPILKKLLLLLVLPFVLGHLLHRPLLGAQKAIKRVSKPFTQGIIVFMVYTAFANSSANAVWDQVGLAYAVQAGVGAASLLIVVSAGVLVSARMVFASPADRIAAFFCGSQKSLATGIPFAVAIFGAHRGGDAISVLILPLMFYHPMQLLLGAALCRWPHVVWGRRR